MRFQVLIFQLSTLIPLPHDHKIDATVLSLALLASVRGVGGWHWYELPSWIIRKKNPGLLFN